jgi:hypothetical protein
MDQRILRLGHSHRVQADSPLPKSHHVDSTSDITPTTKARAEMKEGAVERNPLALALANLFLIRKIFAQLFWLIHREKCQLLGNSVLKGSKPCCCLIWFDSCSW